MNNDSTHKLRLSTLFQTVGAASANCFLLEPTMGRGTVRKYKLEKGLQASFWNCNFQESMELYIQTDMQAEEPFYNITYFLNTDGVQLSDETIVYTINGTWNHFFFCSSTPCKLYIEPSAGVSCLSISFSPRWIDKILQNTSEFETLEKRISRRNSLAVPLTVTLSEKEKLKELLDISDTNPISLFYIKAVVLEMICNCLQKLKDHGENKKEKICLSAILNKTENYLNEHISASQLNLRALAQQVNLSESTLKRHFKKKFGITISAYHRQKKIDYAKKLLYEKGLTVQETAQNLGYKNIQNFRQFLKKYDKKQAVILK